MVKEPSEHQIQCLIIEYLEKFRKKDVYFLRNNSFSGSFTRSNGSKGFIKNNKKGSPDIIICYKGKWIGVEVKSRTGRQSPDQKQAEKDINRCGGEYHIVRALDDLIAIL